MAFIAFALVHSAAASLLQDLQSEPSPYVLDYLDKMNGDCTSAHCIDELDRCADGSDPECQNRLNCIRDAGTTNAGQCLKQMKWAQLDNTEVKVLDCAHENKCMPDEWKGQSSFIELLSKEKDERGLSVEADEASSDMTSEEKAALQVVAAHLVYLEKTEEMVKRTQGMMDEVLKDKSMGLEEKIEALHMLTGHLSLLQESAKKTMEGMGMDTSDFESEESEEEQEEDALEKKLHKEDGTAEEDATEEEEKPAAKAEKKQAKAEKKPAAKVEKKIETKAAKAEKKPETKVEEKKQVAKQEKKPDAKAEKKPEAKVEKKPAAKVEKKPAAKVEKKPAAKAAETKPASKATKPSAFVEDEGKADLHMRGSDE